MVAHNYVIDYIDKQLFILYSGIFPRVVFKVIVTRY